MQRMREGGWCFQHPIALEDQLASMPGFILLLFVTKLLNLHSPFSLPTAHQDLPHLPQALPHHLERLQRKGSGRGVGKAAVEPDYREGEVAGGLGRQLWNQVSSLSTRFRV